MHIVHIIVYNANKFLYGNKVTMYVLSFIQISGQEEISLSLSPLSCDVSAKLQAVTGECEFNKLITAPNFPITDKI